VQVWYLKPFCGPCSLNDFVHTDYNSPGLYVMLNSLYKELAKKNDRHKSERRDARAIAIFSDQAQCRDYMSYASLVSLLGAMVRLFRANLSAKQRPSRSISLRFPGVRGRGGSAARGAKAVASRRGRRRDAGGADVTGRRRGGRGGRVAAGAPAVQEKEALLLEAYKQKERGRG
jgi:hypothetical protein